MATWKKIITSGSTAELNNISASGNIIPITTDGSSLGSVSHNFSDLFLDSGAVINLDGGDVTLTHSSNKLTLAGGSLDVDGGIAIDNITIDGTEIDLSSGDLTVDVAGDIILDAAGKDISMTDGAGTAEFIFNLEDAPELDVDGDFTIDGSGKITLDSAATNINLIGNVTASGVVSASAGFIGGLTGTADVATVATTVTITDNESTDEDNAIVFTAGGDVDGGNLGLESDGTLNYNPSSGKLTATQLGGTLQTAAQTNITSVGALDGGSISSNFGAINNGASAITTTGTVSAGRVNTTGGVHVGGTSDPGTDNLIVDGTSTLPGDVTTTNNVTIGGDLTVNGTTTTIATTNTEVADQFLFLASGSAGSNLDAGIVVQSGSAHNSGSAFYHDMSDQRWSVAKSVAKSHIGAAQGPTSFVTTVKTDTVNPDATSGSYGAGEMHVNTSTGDIWIRFG